MKILWIYRCVACHKIYFDKDLLELMTAWCGVDVDTFHSLCKKCKRLANKGLSLDKIIAKKN